MTYARSIIALCLLGTVVTGGCAKDKDGASTNDDKGVSREFTRGPLAVEVTLDRASPTIADQINLEITATVEEDFEVRLPSFGEKLEQFGIVDYRTLQPELIHKGRTRVSRSYVLEPFLSGDYTIPPMTIRFWKVGTAETNAHTLETEAIPIEVRSLLPDAVEDLEIHDIADPVSIPRSMKPSIWLAVAGAAVLVVATTVILVVLRRRNAAGEAPPPLRAHTIAYTALEQLIAEDLIGQGLTKIFYQRVSDILRHYIENRFGLHAPERTTEEFLGELGNSEALAGPHQALLKDFLGHCDLVKFAELQPATEDIQRTFDSCKMFIEETKIRET